jgi:hypothetical protein
METNIEVINAHTKKVGGYSLLSGGVHTSEG